MKRSLAALLSFALITLSAPPQALAQVRAVVGASGSGSSAAGASFNAGGVQAFELPALGLSPAALTTTLPAAMANLSGQNVSKAPATPVNTVESRIGVAIAAPLNAEALQLALPAAVKTTAKTPALEAKKALKPVTADMRSLTDARREVAEASGALQKGSDSNARSGAAKLFDSLLGIEESGDREPAVEGLPPAGILSANLESSANHETEAFRSSVPSPDSNDPGPRRTKVGGFLKALGSMALGAAVVIGAQAGLVALAPAVFGMVPVAAVWAVSSGLLLFPLALYARYRLAKRDSPRLNKVKTLLDVSIGAFAAAAFLAVPSLGMVLTTANLLTASLPLAAVAGGRFLGGTAFADSMLTWAVLGFGPGLVGVASAAGLIGIAPIIGLMALPAMTTIAFFLGRLIHSAETGQPFAVPGSMQKIRFPSFQWVMIGVVFALLTGFSAVHTNIAFLAWNFLGNREIKWDKSLPILKRIMGVVLSFDALYLGLLAFTAIGGFASPLTFLVIAFSGERAAVWTERLLAKFLPKGAAAPSTKAKPVADPDMLADREAKWPNFHYRLKMVLMIGSMAAAGFLLATTVFGISSLLTNLAIAGALAFIPFFFAKNIIKIMMKAQPTTPEADPEFFDIMHDLRDRINAKRRAAGKKEIPMPEMVIDPMEAPNAYATGRSPFAAMVGVTRGIKAMTLNPENVRDGVVRLISQSDPNTKEFKVFRKAIVGSVTGLQADATPAQVIAAVLKADRSELKALGVRMLRGVLGHEFSHVMDRHMLTGSIGGAIASGVAFASYGVMWGVGHAKILVQKALGIAKKPQAEETPASRPNDEGTDGVRPEALDPISAGVVIKSLPALLRLFAALWSPVVLQILQMASSRNNEGMADEDGAILSEDPESLALALGLLTTWRPPNGFRLPGAAIPRAASMQHVMIVNPLEQLENAGALPKTSANGGPTRADDLIFELFITHPNTGVRIRKLHDMSEAIKDLPGRGGGGGGSAPPGDDEGGGHTLSFLGKDTATGIAGGGLLRGAWEGLKGFFRVLPDEGRNRQFWVFAAGQALIMLGVNFHYTALPKIVAPTKADAANLGYNRAINWGSQAASSLITGPVIDRTSTKKVIVWTGVARAALMAMVPVLFFHGYLGFAAFAALIAVAGFLQMAGMTAGTVAFNRILGDDLDRYNRANAVLTIVMNAVGVVGPLLAGAFIAAMDARFGLLSGNALSYAVYGVLMLACSVGYALFLRVPRDEVTAARRSLHARLKAEGAGDAVRYAGVTAATEKGETVLLVEVVGDPADAVLPAEHEGYKVKAVAKRRVFPELVDGFKTIFADRFLRLYLLSLTLSVMAGDALIFAALPRFLEDILHAGAGAFGLFLAASSLGSGVGSGLMAFATDPEKTALLPQARAFRAALSARDVALKDETLDAAKAAFAGSAAAVLARYKDEWRAGGGAKTVGALERDVLAEAARSVGAALGITEAQAASLLEATGAARGVRGWASRRGLARLEAAREEAAGGMDALQRQGRWSSWLHGLSWLAYALVFLSGNVPLAVGLLLASATLGAPANVAWSSLLTRVVQGGYSESQGRIYSAMFFYQLLLAVAGVLFFGWLMAVLPTATVLLIAGGVLVASAAIDFITPKIIFPIGRKK